MTRSTSQLEPRQAYSGVTSGLQKAAGGASQSASKATASLSRPQIIGIVVAIIALAALVVGMAWYCCVRAAKRRDVRNAAEREQIRQRELQQQLNPSPSTRQDAGWGASAPAYGSRNGGGHALVGMPAAAMSADDFYAAQRRGSEPNTDEDYWKHDPLTPADNSHNAASYVVDFDQHGNPRYHAPNQYAPASPAMTPSERQPMYHR